MKDRKQHVIKMAHQLFMEKGFQNTSIQDILDYSGISKGTFYNYFSSKNELLIAIFTSIFKNLEVERNELLIGKDPSDIDVFIKQVELQMRLNRKNHLLALFEEVFVSRDNDLKEFLQQSYLKYHHWVYNRFIEIFGKEKQPYLLDCAIMFGAILNQNLKYYALAYDKNTGIDKVVSYSVARIMKMVDELSQAGDQLLSPEILTNWLPEENNERAIRETVKHSVNTLMKKLENHEEEDKFSELLLFIEEELLHSNNPRTFLVESALESLKSEATITEDSHLLKLEQIIKDTREQ